MNPLPLPLTIDELWLARAGATLWPPLPRPWGATCPRARRVAGLPMHPPRRPRPGPPDASQPLSPRLLV